MTQLLKTPSDITAWLDCYGIKNYKLVPHKVYGYVVDVESYVYLANKNLSSIDVKFNCVKGFFECDRNKLTSLTGCPKKVGGYFSCSYNELKSLNGCPISVKGCFYCNNNNLTSLKGCPNSVKGDFCCNNNSLKSLKDCPNIIKGGFWCNNNSLENLGYCAQSVGSRFYCHNNALLGDAQKVEEFKEIYHIHEEFVKVKNEKESLNQMIKHPGDTGIKKFYKI